MHKGGLPVGSDGLNVGALHTPGVYTSHPRVCIAHPRGLPFTHQTEKCDDVDTGGVQPEGS